MVMVAPGTTEPVGSVTVPKTVAVWANAAALAMTNKGKTKLHLHIEPPDDVALEGNRCTSLQGPWEALRAEWAICPQPQGVQSIHTQRESGSAVDLSLIHISEPTRLGMISY